MIASGLHLGGLLSLLLGLFHCFFPRIFAWEQEFKRLSPRSARVLHTIHLFLIPFFFFFSYAAFFHTAELAGRSPLGLTLATFYAAFWLVRGVWQLAYFRPPTPAPSTRFVLLHRVLTGVFFAMAAAFALPMAGQWLRL